MFIGWLSMSVGVRTNMRRARPVRRVAHVQRAQLRPRYRGLVYKYNESSAPNSITSLLALDLDELFTCTSEEPGDQSTDRHFYQRQIVHAYYVLQRRYYVLYALLHCALCETAASRNKAILLATCSAFHANVHLCATTRNCEEKRAYKLRAETK